MAQRLIDVPIESLPFVDALSVDVAAGPDAVWDALIAVTGEFTSRPGGSRAARALGCAHTERTGEPGEIGSTIPGFVIARAVRPAVLALMGEHRFSRYALVLTVTDSFARVVRLGAEIRAEFPGAAGTAYRALVIGTRGHVLVTRSFLRSVRRRAERA